MGDSFGGGIACVFIVIGLICFIAWISALVDAIKSDYKNPDHKIIWVLVIVLTGLIGAILWYIIGKKQTYQ